ncbi:MAG TPA: hypothetical protein VLB68_04440 [Pyrinomonadaceae bacterium]|nr:hypothetical protein [Pyrinomonadaceae bacterium]
MTVSLVLALLVTISGTVATYLYDRRASFAARLCAGACFGLAVLGLAGFVFASLLGLTPTAIFLSTSFCCLPFITWFDRAKRQTFFADVKSAIVSAQNLFLKPNAVSVGYALFYGAVILILWKVFDRAMIEDNEGISTGLLNNFGDLPFHLSVVTSFALGDNFPPDDPTYAGVRFTYPFITDFVSAIFVRCGATLSASLFIENILLGVAFVGLVHRWALVMLRDRLAAVITPLLVLLNGGFGFVLLFYNKDNSEKSLARLLTDLPPSFTVIPETTWRWGNAISTLLVPQRGFLMGLPLVVIALTQWWLATEKPGVDEPPAPLGSQDRKSTKSKKRKMEVKVEVAETGLPVSVRRMIAAGVAAGLLPLVHAHSFVVVMAMGGCLALLQIRWREWFVFFVTASLIALPQLFWSTSHSAVHASSFFGIEFGWDHGVENPVWFWFKNTGLFIPLIVLAVLMRGKNPVVRKRVLLFYLPFIICFIVPNFLKMAPWIWDNIKVLFYWWLASAPLVAILLSRLWKQGLFQRVIAVALFVTVTLAGTLDVTGIIFRSVKYSIFDATAVQFAEFVKQKTPARALIVHAPVHNTPVFLTGRRSLMGYPGHIWTHGLEFVQRESEIKRIFGGAPDAPSLISSYKVDYAVVGPQERNVTPVNDRFFAQFEKIGEIGGYELYKVKRQ